MEPLPYQPGGYALALFWATFGRLRASAVREARDSKRMLVALLALGFGLALLPVSATPHEPAVFLAGVVLMLIGLTLRWYAIRTLGRYFTADVAVCPGQRVIERDPYRLIRHPSYSVEPCSGWR